MIHRMLAALAATFALAAADPASAQPYPSRPVKIIVPFAAGGPADVYARFLAQRLQDTMGQPFVVENRPGAGALLAAASVPITDPAPGRSSTTKGWPRADSSRWPMKRA